MVDTSLKISRQISGAQWLSGRVLDLRPRGYGFEPHPRHCVVSSSKNINPSLVLVQPRKTRPFITERLLMGLKESNQTKPDRFLFFSLPNIRILNGSEVTVSEREKSERHFLRYFFDKKLKPDYYKELERKHGRKQ